MDMEDNLSTDDVGARPPSALVASDSETTVLWPRSTITIPEREHTSSSVTAEFLARLALPLHSKKERKRVSFFLIDLWSMVIAQLSV